jgi:small subunit ribosomal protein S6
MIDHYELLAIFPGTQTDEEAQSSVSQIQELLTKNGATITKHEFWGKRKLAYEIKHIRHGFYDLTEFDFEGTKLNQLNSVLRLNDLILRHQLIHRVVKSPERLAAEAALRERIAAKRQAARENEPVAAGAPSLEPAPTAPAEPAGPLEKAQLEAKLEEMLESDKIDI